MHPIPLWREDPQLVVAAKDAVCLHDELAILPPDSLVLRRVLAAVEADLGALQGAERGAAKERDRSS
jgi:hypothetical protein